MITHYTKHFIYLLVNFHDPNALWNDLLIYLMTGKIDKGTKHVTFSMVPLTYHDEATSSDYDDRISDNQLLVFLTRSMTILPVGCDSVLFLISLMDMNILLLCLLKFAIVS